MTTQDPGSETRAGQSAINWLNDQMGALKTQLSRLQQQGDQTQAALLDMNEKLREAEGGLRDLSGRTIGLPAMTEQLRQVSGLLDRIQDAEVLIDTKFDILDRQGSELRERDQSEKNELYRRIQDLERRAEGLLERWSGVDDVGRRFQEDLSRFHLQYQGMHQRLESVESKSARALESINRLEQQHTETDAAVRALRRQDDAIEERSRLAQEIAARVEADVHGHQEEHRTLPLLAERVELLRAERQRVEDRTTRLGESLEEARGRLERLEEAAGHIEQRQKRNDARVDHAHASGLELQRSITDQLLKLNELLARMRRRNIEELDREIKELRVQANLLKQPEE